MDPYTSPAAPSAAAPSAAAPSAAAPSAAARRAARRKSLVGWVAFIAVVAAVATTVIIATRHNRAAAPLAAPVLKTATVTAGNLSTSERIDGTLVMSASIAVLHRIEGQTSSAVPTAGTGAGASTASSNRPAATTSNTVKAAAFGGQIPLCDPNGSGPATTAAPNPSGTTIVPVSTTTSSTTTTPTTTTPTTTTSPNSGTTDPSATTTSVTTTTAPCATPPSTAPATTVAGGAGGGGSRPGAGSGGAGVGGAGVGGGSPAGGSAASSRVSQTVTNIVRAGTPIGLGDVIYRVDNQSVVALGGALPAWRSLSTSSTDGPDVQQLESSLVAMGYDPNHKVTVDNHFDSATKAMVELWQTGLGETATGTVTLGSIVFIPSPTTVLDVTAKVGDAVSDGSKIVTLAAAAEEVVFVVPPADQTHVTPGLSVTVGDTTGTVTTLRSATRNGAVTVEAVVTPTAPIKGASNGATVAVTLAFDNVTGVLLVPAQALLSRLDGTYAVQVKAADSTTSFVTVEYLGVSGLTAGIHADGLAAGATVLVPVG